MERVCKRDLYSMLWLMQVVILGSKKHLLAKIFAALQAPFAGWGRYHEISRITSEDYHPYINERFEPHGLSISLEETRHLMDLVQGIPETINIICDRIIRRTNHPKEIQVDDAALAIREVVSERQTLFEERLSRYTEKEEAFLSELAKAEPLKQPHGKDFLSKIRMSPGGSGPLLNRLEDEAMIYKTDQGYVIGDPLLAYYLRWYR